MRDGFERLAGSSEQNTASLDQAGLNIAGAIDGVGLNVAGGLVDASENVGSSLNNLSANIGFSIIAGAGLLVAGRGLFRG